MPETWENERYCPKLVTFGVAWSYSSAQSDSVLTIAAFCYTVGSTAPVSTDLELLLRALARSRMVCYRSQRPVSRSGRPRRCQRTWSYSSAQSNGQISLLGQVVTPPRSVLLLGQVGRVGVGELGA